jgi:hypothetical protein
MVRKQGPGFIRVTTEGFLRAFLTLYHCGEVATIVTKSHQSESQGSVLYTLIGCPQR